MGIFNEHSFGQQQFGGRGAQGAPGVGFNLTADGNYDMITKRLTNVGAPVSNADSATKKYVDDNSSEKTSLITVDSNIDMKSQFSITKLRTPSSNDDAATKKYVDDSKVDGSVFLKLDGTRQMTGDLNMNNNQIFNIPNPTGSKQPIPLAYGDLAYLHVDGSNMMTNHMNMNNKKITHLQTPTNNTDAATKKYVDDKSKPQDLSPFFKKDGSAPMTGNFNINGNKIINLEDPASDNDAVNKKYVDGHLHQSQVQPSHYKDEFAFLMTNPNQWTDEVDNRTSFIPKKIADLSTKKGNFHDYNHKVLYTTILKNFQGGYKYKMGLNFYRLVGGADYTLCLEILNIDYQLWHKTQISVDDNTSQGLQLGNVSVKKLQHRYTDSLNQTQFMYYHRVIINFKKLTTGNRFFIHILVNIPQDGNDLSVYPMQFSGVYIIAYGIMSKVSNIDPDKVYDYHTAFDVKPTEVVYKVDINANNKKILNIALDRNLNSSAATVGMVKELIPFTTNYVYRRYFEEFYDFTDANIYGLNNISSGIVINSLIPNITIPNKHISDIKKDGLNMNKYSISFNPSANFTNYTLCLVLSNWGRGKKFTLVKKDGNNQDLASLNCNYDLSNAISYLTLLSNNKRDFFNLPRITPSPPRRIPSNRIPKYNNKTVLWLTENANSIVTKAKISEFITTLTLTTSNYAERQHFEFRIYDEDVILSKFMFSPNFYDFDSEAFHRVMLQEKLNGANIL